MPMLLVDSNEPATAPDIYAQLQEYFGKPNVIPVKLPTADLAITLGNGAGILRVERKDPGDLLASIGDGRLVKQVDAMVKSDAWASVVITGHLSYDEEDMLCINGKSTNWFGSRVRGALRAVQWAGCLIETCAPGYYARTVDELVKFASKPTHAQYHPTNRTHRPLVDFFPDDSTRQERIEFLMGLPGVGVKMATSLLEWCGTRNHSAIGTLAEAMSWITLFPDMDKDAGLPALWSPKKAIAAREFLMGQNGGAILTQEAKHE